MVVAGSGRGLERATAVAMANEGASIDIVSRTGTEIEVSAKMIQAAGGAGPQSRLMYRSPPMSVRQDKQNVRLKDAGWLARLAVFFASTIGAENHF